MSKEQHIACPERFNQAPANQDSTGRADTRLSQKEAGRAAASIFLNGGQFAARANGAEDGQKVIGLAFAYMEMGDIEPAQKHFQVVLDMPAPEELRALARMVCGRSL